MGLEPPTILWGRPGEPWLHGIDLLTRRPKIGMVLRPLGRHTLQRAINLGILLERLKEIQGRYAFLRKFFFLQTLMRPKSDLDFL